MDESLLHKLDHQQRLDGQIVVTLHEVLQQDVLVEIRLLLNNKVHLEKGESYGFYLTG